MSIRDDRRVKKFENKQFSPVYLAWIAGQDQGERGKPYRNPYPKGKRHTEFERGYKAADPLGDHHGRNR